MKWLVVLMLLSIGATGFLWFQGREDRLCFHHLSFIDHSVNCEGHVGMMADDLLGPEKVWPKKYILDSIPAKYQRCPFTGDDYTLSFTVGEHPSCPTHGRLIEKYDHHPHSYPQVIIRRQNMIAASGSLSLVLTVIWAVMAVLRTVTHRQKAQP